MLGWKFQPFYQSIHTVTDKVCKKSVRFSRGYVFDLGEGGGGGGMGAKEILGVGG